MKASIGGFLHDALIYGMGDGIAKILTFFALLLYTRLLTPYENGVWSVSLTLINLLFTLLSIGGESTYMRFFLAAAGAPEKQRISSTWLGFLSTSSLVVALVLVPFSSQIASLLLASEKMSLSVKLAVLAVPPMIFNRLCGQFLRNRFRAWHSAILNVFATFLSVGLSLYFLIEGHLGVIGILMGSLAAGLLMVPLRFWTTVPVLRPVFSVRLLRDMMLFGGPVALMELALWIYVSSDRILVGRLSSLEQAGLYAVAATIVRINASFIEALAQVWPLYATKMYEDKVPNIGTLLGRVATYVLAGYGFLSVAVSALSSEILKALAGSAYSSAIWAVAPLALGSVALATTMVTTLPITLTRKSHYFIGISWGIAVFNVALNLLLIPAYGMMAASWSSAVSYTLLTAVYVIVSQRLLHIHYETRRSLTIIGLTAIFTLAAPYLRGSTPIISIALKTGYAVLFVGLLWVFRAFDRREWIIVCNVLQSVIKRSAIWNK